MKTIMLLETFDVVERTDWCRPLEIVSMSGGHSDYYSFVNQYSGTPENNSKWLIADRIFGEHLFGKTVGYINSRPSTIHTYEFIRGEVPQRNQQCLTIEEFKAKVFVEVLKNLIIQKGKYAGRNWFSVQQTDWQYFEWAEQANFAPSINKLYREYCSKFYE